MIPALKDSKTKAREVLVEPIFRQQSKESDKNYTMFLKYRDMSYEDRSLVRLSQELVGDPLYRGVQSSISDASKKWSWKIRIDAYELFVQEYHSERQEKVILELKAEVEIIALKLIRKVKKIAEIKSIDDINDPDLKKDLAIIEALVGKGNAGKFILDAYKTVIGEKLQIGTRTLETLAWKD